MTGSAKLSSVSGKLTPRAKKFLALAVVLAFALTALIIGLAAGLSAQVVETSKRSYDPSDTKTVLEKELIKRKGKEDVPKRDRKSTSKESQHRTFRDAAVTTDTNQCSKYGSDILQSGNGSVVDAAIVTMLCVGMVNMQSTGIGGGFVATIYEKPREETEKVLVTLISRERAPLAATRDMFVNTSDASTLGGKAVAVPGEIKGYYEAWKRFGRMTWNDLFQPVIRLCEEGFYVEKELGNQIKNQEDYIRADPNLSELFVTENGTLIKEGDLLVNKKLGATMRRIAEDPHTYYNGSLANDIVADLDDYGGIITRDDLLAYSASFKEPVNVTIQNGNFVFYNPPPPTSGAVLDFIVNILDGFNFTLENIADDPAKILTYHRLVESYKFAYAKRSNLGDEDFVNVTELVYNLTSDSYAEETRLRIDDTVTHDIEYYDPTFDIKPDSGTSHMNIIAPDGAAFAMTATINLIFGSKARGSRTGIIFNNQMDDFSTPGTYNAFGVPASPANYIEPGKMPMSSMCPTLVFDNNARSVVLMTGASGGTRITTSASFLAINSLWFDIDLGNATDLGRVHHQLVPNEISHETWLRPEIATGLAEKNHTMVAATPGSAVGSVRRRCSPAAECFYEAVSDGRKGGTPAGF